MNKKNKIMMAALAVAGLAGMVFAQGSLTPPGAPGSTMKTLGQLDTSITGVSNRVEVVRSAVATAEPRAPLSSATTISQPGSYYLTGNITVATGNAILIESDDVTLDLNGFTIKSISISAGGIGIYINGTRRNISIANGVIKGGTTYADSTFSGAGFNYGIYSSADANITISDVVVERCVLSGIYLYNHDATVVNSCTVSTCGGYGIAAGRIESCIALDCGNTAIYGDQVTNCRGWSVLTGNGIDAETVRGSYGRTDKGTYGIYATTVQDSYGYASSTSFAVYGIYATTVNNSYGGGSSSSGIARGISGKNINNSYGTGTSSAGDAFGIFGTTVNNCFGYSSCYGSYRGYGIDANTVQNSYGDCGGDSGGAGFGIDAGTVVNSHGYSTRSNTGSRGILAEGPVSDSYAVCGSGHAIEADSADNCRGESVNGYGIYIQKSTINCVGISANSYGISSRTVANCHGTGRGGIIATVVNGSYGEGTSLSGIEAVTVNNSFGTATTASYGITASIVIGCRGINYGTGIGLAAGYANTCNGWSVGGTTNVSATYKYNMP